MGKLKGALFQGIVDPGINRPNSLGSWPLITDY
jgi:hypothetical protein